jgi:hypothetical protein
MLTYKGKASSATVTAELLLRKLASPCSTVDVDVVKRTMAVKGKRHISTNLHAF